MSTTSEFSKTEKNAMLKWFFAGYLRPQSKTLGLAFLFMLIEGSMLGLISYLIKPMFDDVLVAADTSRIGWTAGAIFLVFTMRAFSGYANRLLMAIIRVKTTARLQSDLIAHVLTLDGAFFLKYPPGILQERTRGDCEAASAHWGMIMRSLVRDVVGLLSLLFVAFSIDWVWTALALIAVPFFAFPLRKLQGVVRRHSKQTREAASLVNNRLNEAYHGTTSIKLAGTENREVSRIVAAISRFNKEEIRASRGAAAIPSLIDFMAGFGFCCVLYFGGLEIISGEKTVGDFMAFFTAIGMMIDPARRLGNVSAIWQRATTSLERVRALFDEEPRIKTPARPKALPAPAQTSDIVFSDVNFAYTDTPVLRGASFTAKAGETTALVGASGAGKSTIFQLLVRFADPAQGDVSIGGVPLNQLDLKELRNLFSVVTQDTLLFDESIRDNIVMGADVSDEKLERAIQAAHVAPFLDSLSGGIDTPAGTRGAALSGGQRQRVAIARALLRDSPILLLDEATSALDAQSEKIVQDAVETLSKDRTTLVIAHRLSTIRNADKIVVMDKGQVVDEGSHDALLARGGLYADLYRLQYAEGRTVSDGTPAPAGSGPPPKGSGPEAKGSGFLDRASRAFGSVMGLLSRPRG